MKAKTKADREHLARVAELPCCVCGSQPVECHHIRQSQGMGMKAPHTHTIPLCVTHHRGKEGFHHLGRRAWEKKFGTQSSFLEKVFGQLVWDA